MVFTRIKQAFVGVLFGIFGTLFLGAETCDYSSLSDWRRFDFKGRNLSNRNISGDFTNSSFNRANLSNAELKCSLLDGVDGSICDINSTGKCIRTDVSIKSNRSKERRKKIRALVSQIGKSSGESTSEIKEDTPKTGIDKVPGYLAGETP
jgi:hypothetical protein